MPFIATIAILVDVETEAEAADAVAETMRQHMQQHEPKSCFRDWNYDDGGGAFPSIQEVLPIPADFAPDQPWPDPV